MKICFVSDAGSYHTKKWCQYFVKQGHSVSVISFTPGEIENVDVRIIDVKVNARGGEFGKLKYLLQGRKIRKIIANMNPDIVNVHYATSYGTAAALSGIKGYVLSVWGADVYDFPRSGPIHKAMLKFSLNKAKYIFSTSKAMAEETKKYTDKIIEITPFGVDMELFSPTKAVRKGDSKTEFIVGTVKALTPKYGIDYLLKAIALIKEERSDIPIQVRIAGKGESEGEYRDLANELGLNHIVHWLGFISQEEAAREWANMDVGVVASTLDSESFGVSAVEAEASGTALVISNIPGLMEATKPGISSVVVPRCNERALADAIMELYDNVELRMRIGREGRKFASEHFEINKCFRNVEEIFERMVAND